MQAGTKYAGCKGPVYSTRILLGCVVLSRKTLSKFVSIKGRYFLVADESRLGQKDDTTKSDEKTRVNTYCTPGALGTVPQNIILV